VTGDVNPLDNRLAAGTATTPGAGSSAPASSFWSSLSSFASTHDKLLSMAMQVGGGALSGMQKASQFDQQMALANQKQQWGNSVPSLAPRSLIQSAKVSA
jgi:hypothetical protein